MEDTGKKIKKTKQKIYSSSSSFADGKHSSCLRCCVNEKLTCADILDSRNRLRLIQERCYKKQSSDFKSCNFSKRKINNNEDSVFSESFNSSTLFDEMNYRPKQTRKLKFSCKNLTFSMLLLLFFCHFQRPAIASRSAAFPSPSSRQRVRYRSDPYHRTERSRCENIRIRTCVDVGYNVTDMSLSPSNIYKQTDAMETVHQFKMLIKSKCAEEMKLLVCSIYTPICMPSYNQFLPPCRFICERAREGCEHYFKQYNQPWPELFNCDRYPAYTSENPLCLHFNRSATTQSKNTTPSYPRSLESKSSLPFQKQKPSEISPSNTTELEMQLTKQSNCQCRCFPPMISVSDRTDPLYNQVRTGMVHNCAMPCRSPYFSPGQQQFAELWIKVWSVVCFFVTLVTVGTFLIDTDRFKYPERPIIFLSACYMFVSVGFLIRVVAGHETVACSVKSDRILYKTTGPLLCSIVYMLIYFFGMAAAIWWVFLSLTWFLAAGLKWGSEAIAYYSQYYHGVAWMFPALKSIAILATSSVDGDPLSGICYVGNHNTGTLIAFVIAPLVLYLGLGLFFLVLGYVYLCRIRISIKKVGKRTDTLEKLMKRIGLFSILYMIPSILLLACHWYELQNREKWANAFNCRRPNGLRCIHGAKSRPEFEVFIVKYSVALLIGVTNGVWICSGKTIVSWKQFYRRCYCCVYDLTVIVSWFKRRSMKANMSEGSSETNIEGIPQISSDGTSIETGEVAKHFFLTNHGDIARLSSGDQELSSRDDSAICCNRVAVLGEINQVTEKNEKHKSDPKRRRTSEGRSRTSCFPPECSYNSFESSNQPSLSCMTGINGGTSPKLIDVLIPTETKEGTMVMPICRKNTKHCNPKQMCIAEGGPPLTCHTSRASTGRSLSHRLSNNSYTQPELETGHCFLYCDQSGSIALLEPQSPLLKDSECGRNRIQHIHHHHHHHLEAEAACTCHNRSHFNLRRSNNQKHCHSSSDSGSSKLFFQRDTQRVVRISSPIDRNSPTGYNALRR